MNRLLRSSWGRFLIAILFILLAVAFAADRLLSTKPSHISFGTVPATPQISTAPSFGSTLMNLPGALNTQVARLPSIVPVIPTPWPPPVQDLALLVSQAQAIAEAKIVGTNGAEQSLMYSLAVKKWLKKPSSVVTDTGTLWVSDPKQYNIPSYGFRDFRDMQADRGSQFVLFMTVNINGTFSDIPDYYLVGSPIGYFDSGFFHIVDGKIDKGGIPAYDGWPVGKFEDEITKLEMRSPNP